MDANQMKNKLSILLIEDNFHLVISQQLAACFKQKKQLQIYI
ncbi:hypothetical protein GLIP_0608 [Aliiglaciecola lipolytica E3]|uniref:Uncharacterized protein n=1 Tax=Aliiglaciecola lipolytica E3 TaxID=1127673 RepID=K6WXQ3_9ALTE|nr:hypothetical protein GLIP_0608 [Aliiglaciecola lipolytica E3]